MPEWAALYRQGLDAYGRGEAESVERRSGFHQGGRCKGDIHHLRHGSGQRRCFSAREAIRLNGGSQMR